MTQSGEYGERAGSDEGHDGRQAPATWPRDPRERAQPRSRLHQALSVAGRHADLTDPGSGHIPGEAEPGAFQRAFSDILGEGRSPTLPTGAAHTAAGHAPLEDEGPSTFVDLREDAEVRAPLATRSAAHYGLGDRWGRSWRDSAQGWVSTPSGDPVWRPVVATTDELASWDVDTYLGVVTSEVAIDLGAGDQRRMGATLARGREVGIDGLVEEAIERGAHAVVGVSMQYTPLGERLLLTMSGTAVTLRDKRALQS